MHLSKWLRSRWDRRSFPWAVVVAIAAFAPIVGVLAWLLIAAEHRVDPPTCYGIGWGCTLDATSSGVAAGFFWLVATAAVAAALAITEFFWARVAVARSIVLLVVLFVALGLVVWLGVAVALAP